MKCPKCNNEMENLGNIDNKIYCSLPPQWDDVYVCHKCECKKTIRKHGKDILINYGYVNDYKEIKDE